MNTVDLGKYRSTGQKVLSGRARGKKVREELGLDVADEDHSPVVVAVPDDLYSLNISFFLGLFGPSVDTLGSRERFFEKYSFKATDEIQSDIDLAVDFALRSSSVLD